MLLAGQSSRCGWQGGALDWSNFRGQPNPAPGPEATGKIADFAGPQSSSFGNSTVTRSRTPAIIFLLLVWPSGLLAKEFTGRVVGVTDGDTISVLHAGRAEKIRLYGIDAPERGQPFTHSAKEFVSKLCFGKEVTVKPLGRDRYRRTLGDVLLPDGRNLNHEIVKQVSPGGFVNMRHTILSWRS
jgi:endonuclease YncB( thermonuclease family)